LMDAFARGVDLHTQTASMMLGIPLDDVTSDQRQLGKTLNFGLIFGMNANGLAYRIEVSEAEAESLIESYFRAMPKARIWIDKTHRDARKSGGIRTHFGRWRPLPEINSKNYRERGKGERGSVNSIVQGTAADIAKIAMVRAGRVIEPYGDKVQLVLTIHDDLTFLVHDSVSNDELVPKLVEAMEFDIKGYVDLKVDVSVGPTWGDLEQIEFDSPNPDPEPASIPEVEEPVKDKRKLELREGLNEKDLDEIRKLMTGGEIIPILILDGSEIELDGWSLTEDGWTTLENGYGIADEVSEEPVTPESIEFA